ncbi:hypothetical protein [Apilactobacillus micheneri]|nr:hypothetical protein [Apilactobacillus micheneri]
MIQTIIMMTRAISNSTDNNQNTDKRIPDNRIKGKETSLFRI